MKALLPSCPLRRGAVLVALLGLSALYFVHTYVHRPRMEEADALRLRIDHLEALRRQLEVDLPVGTDDPQGRLEAYAAHLARLETLLPADQEVAALLAAISVAERRTGVDVTMLRPGPHEAGEVYDRWSYQVAARGGYHQIASFMTAIASLERTMVPSDVNIGVDPAPRENPYDAGASLVAGFRIRTYIRPGRGLPKL